MSNKEAWLYLCLGAVAGFVITLLGFQAYLDHTMPTIEIRATHTELQRCIECDAPMWSDQWCQDCYGVWYEITGGR